MINKIYSGEYVGPVNYSGRLAIRAVLHWEHSLVSAHPAGAHWPLQASKARVPFLCHLKQLSRWVSQLETELCVVSREIANSILLG